MDYSEKDLERFWAKVTKGDDCWLWTAGKDNFGYGQFRLKGKNIKAHRVSFFLEHGYWPKVSRHTCDNPPCVRPKHIIEGTHKDNSDDKVKRDRHGFTLSNEQVTDIRSRPLSMTICRDIAAEFGISSSEAKMLLTGERYHWLPGGREIPIQYTGWKLTAGQVLEIINELNSRSYWGQQSDLAKKYGVGRANINHIAKGRLIYARTDTQ